MSLKLIASTEVGRRLLRGFGATSLSPVVAGIIQLGPTPLLLHAWHAAKYGDYLLLSAIPSYLTLSNLGLGDASGSDMTVRVAAGDRDGALETFQSSWILLSVVSLVMFLLIALSVWWIPWQQWMRLSSLSNSQAAEVVLAFSAYVFVTQLGGVIESGYRCNGHFATGTFWLTGVRLLEALVACAIGVLTGNLLSVAVSYLAVRSIGTLGFAFLLRRKTPWLQFGTRYVSVRALKTLSAPAFGFMALPLGYAISLQGFTIMIGAVLGPLAVTSFSTLRTLTRISSQLLNAVGWTAWPEYSSNFGMRDLRLARTLHRRTFQLGLLLAGCSVAILWVVGPTFYRLWVRKAVTFDANCFHILLGVAFFDSLWFLSSVVLMAKNVHQRVATVFVIGSLICVFIGHSLVLRWGIVGAAWPLLLNSIFMIWLVGRCALRELQDSPKDFMAALVRIPTVLRTNRAAVSRPDVDSVANVV